jgi:hypothetical protein
MLQAVATLGVSGLARLGLGQTVTVSRICENMRREGYTDKELTFFLRALFSKAPSRHDVRAAWWVLDRRHLGKMPRAECERALLSIIGEQVADTLTHLLDRLGSEGAAEIDSGEFAELMVGLAEAASDDSLVSYVGKGLGDAATLVGHGARDTMNSLRHLDAAVVLRLPPALLPRSGRVVERLLKAGYDVQAANNAVTALYIRRETLHLARLWGMFDVGRCGHVSVKEFDRAILLLTDVTSMRLKPLLQLSG